MMDSVQKITVGEIMTSVVFTAKVDDDLLKVDKIFTENNVHHLPILDGDELVGIISHGDLLLMKDWGTRLNLKNSLKSNYNILRSNLASDIMSTALVTVTENYTLKQVAGLMKNNKYRAFPVLENGKLKGIITSYDIIQKVFS